MYELSNGEGAYLASVPVLCASEQHQTRKPPGAVPSIRAYQELQTCYAGRSCEPQKSRDDGRNKAKTDKGVTVDFRPDQGRVIPLYTA